MRLPVMKTCPLPLKPLSVEIPAHPLFPVSQPILWLPGLPGPRPAFCSYNRLREGKSRKDSLSAPFPVSPASFISWHTDLSPALPFHPVPISRLLSNLELERLSHLVILELGILPEHGLPLHVLRSDAKTAIYRALAAMGVNTVACMDATQFS